ncbi:MAG: hypothetical protein FJ255_11825 [Phycisphaerae bacterium]|nr:hypothetical protein [Phycisphaerae bacterium]
MIRSIVCIVALWAGWSAMAQTPTPEAPAGYRLGEGPYKAAEIDLELEDAARDKQLPIKVRFPKGLSVPAPLVVFSHGMGGSGDAFGDLTTHWATLGYVVILPTHDDSAQLRRKRGEPATEVLRDLSSGTRSVDPAGRLADVVLILDSLAIVEDEIPGLRGPDGAGLIDRVRAAIAGHSAGALTTQMAIGVKVRGRRMGADGVTPRDLGDRRLKAAIVISGQGTTNLAFTKESWAALDRPMMVIAGSLDTSRVSNETPESRRHPYELARPGDKYLVWIEGATHGSYQGKTATTLLRERPTTDVALITAVVSSATSAFLDAHLRGDGGAREFLASDGLSRQGQGHVTFERK